MTALGQRVGTRVIQMDVTIQVPDDVAARLRGAHEMPRHFLEAFAADAYRAGKLTRHEVSVLLGFDYWQTETFLNEREARRPYSLDDLNIDRQSLARMDAK